MSLPHQPPEGAQNGNAIKQKFLLLFSVSEPPIPGKAEVLDILNFGPSKEKKRFTIIRPVDTIYVSFQHYHQLNDVYDLGSLPAIIYYIVREKDEAKNRADLGRIFDAIKPHITLFKRSSIGVHILHSMIKNDYFSIKENQGFLRSFFHDITTKEKHNLIYILCEEPKDRPKIISLLIEICGYTEEEIEAHLQ